MQKLTITIICALCLLFTACGGDDLKDARKVFDQYCAAASNGDIDKLASLTSAHFRAEYEKMPAITDPDLIAMGKAYNKASKYEVLSMEQAGQEIIVKTKVSVPDPFHIMERVQATTPMQEFMNLTSEEQAANFMARKMKHILETEDVPLLAVDMDVPMVKEDGRWKVHFPVNAQSGM